MIGRVISVVLTIVIVAIITFTMHAASVFAQTPHQPPRITFCDLTKNTSSRCIHGEKVYTVLSKEEAQFVRTKLLKIKFNSTKDEISTLLQAEITHIGRTSYFMEKGKQVGYHSVHWLEKKNSGRDMTWRLNNDGQVTIDYIDELISKVSWIKQMGSRFIVITLIN